MLQAEVAQLFKTKDGISLCTPSLLVDLLTGLLAIALGRLPAAFSSLVIFLEAIAAAGFGWLILNEPVSAAQALGGLAILAGIFVARPR